MLASLKRSAQAIAQPSAVQLALFPEFVEVADELALALEEAIQNLDSISAAWMRSCSATSQSSMRM